MGVAVQERIDAALLAAPSDAVALVDERGPLRYGDLRELVAERAAGLDLGAPGIVVLQGPPSVDWVVTYLALLHDRHVPLLAGPNAGDLVRAWSPLAAIRVDGGGPSVTHLGGRRPELHPDLALLLSTSGSTGSPKLVRLSHRNLAANARAIAEALGLGPADRGITSLPLHYCFGLSVLHSHLAVGASVAVTGASVVDPCFAAALRDHEVTNLAGVPHSFEMLEVAGPERLATGSLRLLCQAGGRLGAEARRRWRERAASWGAELAVMYGQTEATARMAVLPPALAHHAGPDAVGLPVPGGELVVDGAAADGDVGELVYRGPNVMLGYATEPSDLALGATLDELRTGDLGRIDPATGLVEVVGRASRFTKPLGLRVDLDRVEDVVALDHPGAVVAGDDELLVVAAPEGTVGRLADDAATAAGLPRSAVVAVVGPLPRTPAGKVDGPALLAAARAQRDAACAPSAEGARPSAILAEVLGRDGLGPEESFAGAGGDSLSYVEASLRLEERFGALPPDWQHLSMADLDASEPRPPDHRMDTTVLLRAVGICTVVATHLRFGFLPGGAHLLLGVAGYNLCRFQLGLADGSARLRAGFRTIARVALPAMAVAALVVALTPRYGWTTIALVNDYLGPRSHRQDHWHFWYIEAFVHLVAIITLVLAVPAVRRWERRAPYLFALGALGVALAAREVTWWGIDDPYNLRFRTHGVAFFLVLGWLVHRSRTPLQRVATSVLCVVTVAGFFGMPEREAYIAGGLLLLLWVPRVPVPRRAAAPIGLVASASMWILISHFQVWPPLQEHLPTPVAYVATIAAGLATWWAAGRVGAVARSRWALRAGAAARAGGRASEAAPPGPRSGRSIEPAVAR